MQAVEQPIDDPRVWRAGENRASRSAHPTGFEVLDRHLPGAAGGLARMGMMAGLARIGMIGSTSPNSSPKNGMGPRFDG